MQIFKIMNLQNLQRINIDFPILILILTLITISQITLYSASSANDAFIIKQFLRLAVSLGVMLLVSQIHPRVLYYWAPVIYGFSLFFLIIVLLTGHIGKGAQRWINLGVIKFQPSELMKIACPLIVAWYLSLKESQPNFINIIISCILILLPCALIIKQPDLGTAILIGLGGFYVLFFAGINYKYILFSILSTIIALPIFWHFLHDYQRQRVITFLNPENDPLGAGYHIIQSKIAIGSGGIFGKGLFQGTQSQLQFLPERTTDFIFAVFCEEFGIIGTLVLLIVYLLIIARGIFISINAPDKFTRLLSGSLTLIFFTYVAVNMGMVTGILPVVGVPLPLISFGGTSMITLLISFGILISIHKNKSFMVK